MVATPLMWPLILATSGATLLWRQQAGKNVPPGSSSTNAARRLGCAPGRPGQLSGCAAAGRRAAGTAEVSRGSQFADLYRGGFGVALVVGAALALPLLRTTSSAIRARSLFTVIAATAGLALILAPFLWRLGRNLASERAERIRSQERAELAAHLHDSVLQTLTLVQKRAGDPREVAQLARRQERELRSWLFDADRAPASASLAAALEHAAAEVEDAHGVPIEVVAVGDHAMDERAEAIVAATREAIVNAAKFAPDAGEIAVYAELDDRRAQVFVRDRGPGFDPDGVPGDRRGVRESIIGRMERYGGTAEIRSSPGAGTEVALTDRRVASERRRRSSVVIVDDHAIFRSGVRAELEGLVDVRGDAGSVEEAVRLITEAKPDVVLLDVHMPGGGGVEVIRRVAETAPAQRFLALSVSDAAEDVIAVVRAGARGYVTKTISGPDLADAVTPGSRRRRGLLTPARRLRPRRLRGAAPRAPRSTPSSTS